mgnify:CR=1 FL=1
MLTNSCSAGQCDETTIRESDYMCSHVSSCNSCASSSRCEYGNTGCTRRSASTQVCLFPVIHHLSHPTQTCLPPTHPLANPSPSNPSPSDHPPSDLSTIVCIYCMSVYRCSCPASIIPISVVRTCVRPTMIARSVTRSMAVCGQGQTSCV